MPFRWIPKIYRNAKGTIYKDSNQYKIISHFQQLSLKAKRQLIISDINQ